MRNIRLTIEYLGTAYFGWQYLPGRPTVQGKIKEVLEKLLSHDVRVTGASRTDAGVHALGQVANFFTPREMPLEKIKSAMNALLPRDIRIVGVEEADPLFNARKSAIGKRYRYRILNREVASPFEIDRAWFVPWELDIDAMRKASLFLVGTHDFATFSKSDRKSKPKSTVKTIDEIVIEKKGNIIELTFFGRSFLRHMLRIITAVLVEIGRGKFPPEYVKEILEKKDRKYAPFLAPPCGLYLEKVYYREYPYSKSLR